MTQTTFILLTSFTLIYACGQSPQPDKSNNSVDTHDTVSNDIAPKPTEVKESNTKTVSTIVTFIDSLYDIKEPQAVDTIINWTVSADHRYESGPRGLDLTGLDRYYRYLSFHFLLFKDKTAAKKQFDRVAEVGSYRRLDHSDPNRELYWKIFSKAGSAYTLYDNMIIYHHRRCNYNEKIEVPKEDKLLDFLFNNNPPDSTYFIRVRCGWGQHDKK